MFAEDETETDNTKKFNELFCELEHCNEDEQRKKIEEMNEIIEGMNEEEFRSIFKTELFKKLDKMIEEKKLSVENAILLLKHAGYLKTLKNIWIFDFRNSSLNKRIEKMIIEEDKKNEEKNENFLVGLCKCYILLNRDASSELILISMPCLLKAALRKEESEETRKEVEIALLALSNINEYSKMKQELYLKEMLEIIKHQQKHRNLTKLAYQCAWQFFIYRLDTDKSLNEVILNELHFGRESSRELEELTRKVNWKKKKEEEMIKEEVNEVLIIKRWIETFSIYFQSCRLKNEENVELINSIVQVYRAAKGNNEVICNLCIHSLKNAAKNRVVKVEDLLNGGAVNTVLEEMHRQTLNEMMVYECLQFFTNVSNRLKEKKKNEMEEEEEEEEFDEGDEERDDEKEEEKEEEEEGEEEEEERKITKRKVFEKMEEEGYEDVITSFHKIYDFLLRIYSLGTSLKISDYFVNV